MDFKEIADAPGKYQAFEEIKQRIARASLRNGQTVRDFTSANELVASLMKSLEQMDSTVDQAHGPTRVPYYAPPSYPPCVLSAQELKPLMISTMRLGEHHRGHRTTVHILTPAGRKNTIMAIGEDEEGTAVLLVLYNQPDDDQVSNRLFFRQGDVCILKEPLFMGYSDGMYNLQVHHVSDIIWLEGTDHRTPSKWRRDLLSGGETSEDIRKQGNAAVKEEDWVTAERLYTQASNIATTCEETRLALLNRSLVNLRLDRPEKALDDARMSRVPGNGAADEMPLFREAKALYALRQFEVCMERLLSLVRLNPRNTDAWAEIKRVKQRQREAETGAYDFRSMYRQAEATPPIIDCATYTGPVAVRDAGHRGRGLFTTRPVKAGELLFCEKAFAYSYAHNHDSVGRYESTVLVNFDNETLCVGGQTRLIAQVVQKLYHNPSVAEAITDLHHGDYIPVSIREVDGAPVVDTSLIVKIIKLNAFGAPRSTQHYLLDKMFGNSRDRFPVVAPAYTTCGIWPLASRINHSCITNCCRSFIGDMQIVRACQDLEADTELYFAYKSSLMYQTYEETQKKLGKWGFVCACALCSDKKHTTQSVLQQRMALEVELASLKELGTSKTKLQRAKTILQSLQETYTPQEDGLSVPPVQLFLTYFARAIELFQRELLEGLEMLLKGLEALGFVIVASPPRLTIEGKEQKTPKLEIKRWGQTNHLVDFAFSHMIHIYGNIAPELRDVAKEYTRVAYTISRGESESIIIRYPLWF